MLWCAARVSVNSASNAVNRALRCQGCTVVMFSVVQYPGSMNHTASKTHLAWSCLGAPGHENARKSGNEMPMLHNRPWGPGLEAGHEGMKVFFFLRQNSLLPSVRPVGAAVVAQSMQDSGRRSGWRHGWERGCDTEVHRTRRLANIRIDVGCTRPSFPCSVLLCLLVVIPCSLPFVVHTSAAGWRCGTHGLKPLSPKATVSSNLGMGSLGIRCGFGRNDESANVHNGRAEQEAGGTIQGNQHSRRVALRSFGAAAVGLLPGGISNAANAGDILASKRTYFQRFPTLFAPLYGRSTKETIRREMGEGIWALEQNLELGPLETPLRCVVIRLNDGTLWVHAPLAPTEEFFELVESCGDGLNSVAHVVIPTYALEHKVFAKDALMRWPKARLWTAPGQFSFPLRSVPDEYVWGKPVSGVLYGSDEDKDASRARIPWTDEIQYETLAAGTFTVGLSQVTFYETAFFHVQSKTLIVTDALAEVSATPPSLSSPEKLLLISKESTADPFPDDTVAARQIG
jgi:hypothetical protein